MERFNYPNLAAAAAEDASIIRYMQIVDEFGRGRDQQDRIEQLESELEEMRNTSEQ